jgi:GDPmannose 4,6-dehydratase
MARRALIIGITGQDGAYLSRLLLQRGYEVHGTSRVARPAVLGGLRALGIEAQVKVSPMAPGDFRSVAQTLSRVQPDEIYNLSGQSSVSMSFEQPIETLDSVVVATGSLLEAIRFLQLKTRFYNACSSECFGDTGERPADEQTPFRPRSPYAVAKAAAFWLVANYREAYGLKACSGLLFNHESPLRPEHFVTRKIVTAAVRIAAGSGERLQLGNLSVRRDWGWAPEYVDAMHRMLQVDEPQDCVVATGQTIALSDFVERSFAQLGLDWNDHVDIDSRLLRPSEAAVSAGNPQRAFESLGWQATTRVDGVIERLIAHAQGREPNPEIADVTV